jgi:acetyl-CoA carboxylase biotin carboxyl carrier protein
MFKFNIDKKAIEELLQVLKDNNLSEIEVKDGNKSIKIAKMGLQVQAFTSKSNDNLIENVQSNTKQNKKQKEEVSYDNSVKAPMLGTLYYASSPKAQPFIKIGKKIKVGDVLFIIEAMKTMNQVKSDREGVVKKILVENGLPVEFNQDLVIIE